MDKKQEFILALFAKDEIRFLTDEALKERVNTYEHIYEVMMEALRDNRAQQIKEGACPHDRGASLDGQHRIVCNICGKPLGGPPSPSWKDAPVWARWLAQDEDGEWFWYEEKPSLPDGYLVWAKALNGKVLAAPAGSKNPNYARTLERRP